MPDTERPPPASMGELLDYVMATRDYRSLAELARHTTIPYQTLWAWHNRSRSMKRAPARPVLTRFARDFGLPETMVFLAAGLTPPEPGPVMDPEDIKIAHLWRQLPDPKRKAVEAMIRAMLDNEAG